MPPEHELADGQARVHVPQWFRSVAVSTHWFPHCVSPAGQAHTPFVHVVPPLQLCPH